MLLRKLSISLVLLLFFSVTLFAQSTPCSLLGQNPQTAFPVCGTAVFHQDTVPYCGGRQVATLCVDDSLYTDRNPYWYKFTCFQSGKLAFFITPNTITEDYDWQIFDVTGKSPQSVYTDTSTFVICSWSGVPGVTGACEDSGGVSMVECEGMFTNRFTKMPDLVAGHNYLLLVSHFDNTQYGYGLSFGGPGNTAVITDTLPPHMFTTSRSTCDGSGIMLKLNKRMKCSSLAADGSDFRINPPLANVISATGLGCTNGFDMDSVLLRFSTPLPFGNYDLIAKNGGDGNTVWDLCDNGIPINESIPFTVLSPFPVPFDSLNHNKCSTDSVILVFDDLVQCSSVAPNGSDFIVNGSYPVTITGANPLNCNAGLTRQVAVHFSNNLFQPGNFQIILKVGTDGNTILSECDTPSVAGQAIPFSILPKPVASFSFPQTVCLPDAKVLFTNTSAIADGSESSFRYAWNFDDPLSGPNNTSQQKTPTHTYSSTGPFNVKLRVISNAGCTHDTSILVNTIHPQPLANFGIRKSNVCLGDAVFLTDSTINPAGITMEWNWDMGDSKQLYTKNVIYIYDAPKTYNISLYTVNNFGCRSNTIVKPITVHPYPTADAGPDRKVLEGGNLTIQASAGGSNLSYVWSPPQYLNNTGLLQPKCVEPKFDILYTLTVTGIGGCSVSDDMFVDVLKIPRIPNTFSPNGDRINDLWEIQYLEEYNSNHLRVFTRAGQLVFESIGQYKAWDGTYKGKPLPMDTYYYILEPGNGRDPVTGYVTIVR